MSTGWGSTVSALLLIGNAFFVAAEFALVAARRHRLEQAAANGSRAARAAVSGVRQLSLMLAGAQLGITLCTLGLGALAEPAIAHVIDPVLHAVGVPEEVSYGIAFGLALALVTFLHMVVGEMAPKSWAITDPQRSALLLALPFRAFTTVARPFLVALNGLANGTLHLVKVTPVDELAQAHGPVELRLLLESSRQHGTLRGGEHQLLTRILRLQDITVADIAVSWPQVVTAPTDTSAAAIEETSLRTGRSRLVVVEPGTDGLPRGMVHVREAIRAVGAGREEATAAELMRAIHTLPAGMSVLAGVRAMRERRDQLAVVAHGSGRPVGVVALEDLIEQVIGPFQDETDEPTAVPADRI